LNDTETSAIVAWTSDTQFQVRLRSSVADGGYDLLLEKQTSRKFVVLLAEQTQGYAVDLAIITPFI